jgi:uncharacterized protein YcbK (DUF882 family)
VIHDWSKYAPYFRELEFDCSHCGKNEMKPEFMDKLLELRIALDEPMAISSGYRCPDHNDAVSSTGRNGPHTTGYAADIKVFSSRARDLGALASEFPRVGVSQKGDHGSRFIHLDCVPGKPSTIWSY